jgi:hypothetical protein
MSTELVEYRIGVLEGVARDMSDAVQRLVRLEERHVETREALGRAFDEIKATNARVSTLEQEQPVTKLARGWVLAAVVGTISLLAGGGVALLVRLAPHAT